VRQVAAARVELRVERESREAAEREAAAAREGRVEVEARYPRAAEENALLRAQLAELDAQRQMLQVTASFSKIDFRWMKRWKHSAYRPDRNRPAAERDCGGF